MYVCMYVFVFGSFVNKYYVCMYVCVDHIVLLVLLDKYAVSSSHDNHPRSQLRAEECARGSVIHL